MTAKTGLGSSDAAPFVAIADPAVRGYLHTPPKPSGEALVLAHGAGSNAKAPLLVALARALAEAGFAVLRCDLPYRQKRPYGPPLGLGAAKEDRAGLRNAVGAMRSLGGAKRIFLGGHSYGGRQASILAAESPGLVDGLLLLSYPLRPPKKPEQLRTSHFPELRTPALLVHGSRDPFASLPELEAAIKLIPAPVSLLAIEGVGHDLGFGRKVAPGSLGLSRQILTRFQAFFGAGRAGASTSHAPVLPTPEHASDGME